MTGSFHEIGEVLSNVGSLNRIVSPMNLSLQLAAQSNSMRAVAGRQPLTATFEIQTYVVRTKPPKKKEAKKKAGGGTPAEGGA
jgi:Tfp pilus assembly protein PilO